MAHRFKSFKVSEVTLNNYEEVLPESLARQVEMFLPRGDLLMLGAYIDTWKT
jgi:predicted cation transporter